MNKALLNFIFLILQITIQQDGPFKNRHHSRFEYKIEEIYQPYQQTHYQINKNESLNQVIQQPKYLYQMDDIYQPYQYQIDQHESFNQVIQQPKYLYQMDDIYQPYQQIQQPKPFCGHLCQKRLKLELIRDQMIEKIKLQILYQDIEKLYSIQEQIATKQIKTPPPIELKETEIKYTDDNLQGGDFLAQLFQTPTLAVEPQPIKPSNPVTILRSEDQQINNQRFQQESRINTRGEKNRPQQFITPFGF